MSEGGELARLLDKALRELGDAGRTELACRLAAQAFAVLEKSDPGLAERFTGTLHHLTCVPPTMSPQATEAAAQGVGG
ncbi:MAG: hypothetical protein ACYCX9_10200 [Candidatus Dormibacteria bacterium]|jgi:hypothetical protein